MVVTPPIAADLVPLAKSSLCVSPGSLMWTWRSTAPGRISASPWSIDSSARRVFRTAAILPSSSIPTLSGSRRPRYQTRPLMTRTRRLHLPAHDGPTRLHFGEDLRLERVDAGCGFEPRVREEAGLHARLREEVGRVEVLLDRDLREQNAPVRTLRDAQPVDTNRHMGGQLLRFLDFDQTGRREDADLDRHGVQFLGPHRREPRVAVEHSRLATGARTFTLSAAFSARPPPRKALSDLTSHQRNRMRARIPVVEIMTPNPVTISGEATGAEAAKVMRDKDIGSLVVLDRGNATGIVTERDLVKKVAASDLQPSRVRVKDIMTSPLVAVHPHEEVVEAAKLMSERKIRRLPVVDDGKLVGMITENDIIRIWPTLIEVTREYARAGLEEQFAKGIEGHCEVCGVYSTNLMWDRNLLACPECRGG